MNDLLNKIGMLAFVIATGPLRLIAAGWTLHIMWGWFITAWASPGTITLAGIVAAWNLIRYRNSKTEKKTWTDLLTDLLAAVLSCGATLLMGWLLTLFL